MAEERFRPDPAAQAEALRRMGARIAARRKALGLTQKQLAARLLVSDKTVSKWELGGSCPDPALLVPLARTLGLTVDELLTGEAPPAPHNAPPAGESPAAGKPPAPEPDGWLGWRLDQKAAGISLLGLLLGGAGYSLFLPMQSLLGGQVGWVPAGLVVVAAVALLLAAGSWYRGQCRALGAASRPLPGLALCWLAALAPVFLLAGRLTTGQTGAWYRLPRGLTADQVFDGGQAPAWLTGLSAALPAAVLLLPLAMMAAAAALYLYAAGRQARPGRLLPALPGLLLAQGACLYGSGQAATALPDGWYAAEALPADPVAAVYLPPVLAAGGVWLAVCLALAAWTARRHGRAAWRMLPAWALLFLLPAAADFAALRAGVRLCTDGPADGYMAYRAVYTALPLLLASCAALLACGWAAARQPQAAGQ